MLCCVSMCVHVYVYVYIHMCVYVLVCGYVRACMKRERVCVFDVCALVLSRFTTLSLLPLSL
jgi:hypothetical protein